jgi:protein-L-isoaspartate(D-aspartate) O-methyltransferase
MARQLVDTFRHQGMRQKLIDHLKNKGITDELVLKAMGMVPRHLFLDPAFVEYAYSDRPFEIGAGQTISQPYTVAFQSQLLEIKENSRPRVLEIGTGSGYQAVVLEKMGARVFTIERHRQLFDSTKKLLDRMHSGVKMFYGDGFKGQPAFAPYDRVLVTCGAPKIPYSLVDQLKPGGILVVPVGVGPQQTMTRLVHREEGDEVTEWGRFRFVPMLQNKT